MGSTSRGVPDAPPAGTTLLSLDIFDTCLTRSFSEPSDLFLELGKRSLGDGLHSLKPAEFRDHRVQAESKARSLVESSEVTLADIYKELGARLSWDQDRQAVAMRLEESIESESLRGVSAIRSAVAELRAQVPQIAFISDMYLSSEFLKSLLIREGFWSDEDHIFVSCEQGCSKGSGRLFLKVAMAMGVSFQEWVHWGDNERSDKRLPSKLGIRCELVTLCRPARILTVAPRVPFEDPCVPSLLGGAVRRSLVSVEASTACHRDAFALGAEIAGPILFGFVHWCLESAMARGLERLYFVARDGQVLQRIAALMAEKRGLRLDCRYLYGSRQAWHPAAFSEFTEAEFGWVFAPSRFLTLRQLLTRLGLLDSGALAFWKGAGIDLDVNMPPSLRNQVGRWLLSSVRSDIEAVALTRRELALAYLDQEGLRDDHLWGMVDIGWGGNLQRSLAKLLALARSGPGRCIPAFYFGLNHPESTSPDLPRAAYWNDPEFAGADIKRMNQAMIEIFTMADHATVIGYERSPDGEVHPTFAEAGNARAIQWGVTDFHSGITTFARHALELVPNRAWETRPLRALCKELFYSFYNRPTQREARTLGGYPFSDQQIETRFDSMTPLSSEWMQFRSILDWNRRPIGWWPEGIRAQTWSPSISGYLAVRDLWRRCRGRRF